MIKINNISFRYEDKFIFKNFSDEIKNYQKVAVIGESGCGKSTFLNFLAGFEIPNSGEILIDNKKVNEENIYSIRQKIAWLPQNFNFPFESLNELFYSTFDIKINKNKTPDKENINKIFSALSIETSLLNKTINNVSGGEKQRIMLASVILTQKKYLIIDEPTSALDKHSSLKLLDLLFNLKTTTVIAATHDKTFIDKADKIINLFNQRFV